MSLPPLASKKWESSLTFLLILVDQINFVLHSYLNKDKQIHFKYFHV